MRTLNLVDEFRQEATQALFNKQQAIAVTYKLLEMELANPANSAQDQAILAAAAQRVSIRYLDQTQTGTDQLLDSLGVARFTAQNITDALKTLIFESSM